MIRLEDAPGIQDPTFACGHWIVTSLQRFQVLVQSRIRRIHNSLAFAWLTFETKVEMKARHFLGVPQYHL